MTGRGAPSRSPNPSWIGLVGSGGVGGYFGGRLAEAGEDVHFIALFAFVWLYFSAAGAGPWALDRMIGSRAPQPYGSSADSP